MSQPFKPHTRDCGDCQVCCELLRVKPLKKPARMKCAYQCDTGCAIHGSAQMPDACRVFSCSWLEGEGEESDRPDKIGVMFETSWLGRRIGDGLKALLAVFVDQDDRLKNHTETLERIVRPGVAVWAVNGKDDIEAASATQEDNVQVQHMVRSLGTGSMHYVYRD